MQCDRCRRPAAIFQQYSGNRLCDRHFVLDFERRVKRTIRFEGGICNGDHIAVALSGGPSSIALARVLSGILSGRRDTALFAITINEGRMDRIRYARQTAAILGMKWRVDCDSDFSAPAEEKTDLVPILCDMARESGATRLALGSTVEDCAFSIFTSLYSGKIQHRMTSGTNRPVHCPGLTVIQPLSAIPEEEARLYAELTTGAALGSGFSGPGLDRTDSLRAMFTEFCRKHPSTPFALLKLGEGLEIYPIPDLARSDPGTGPAPGTGKNPGVYAD